MRLLRARRPIDAVLAEASTPQQLREQLNMIQEVRAYATGLGLDVGERYTSYVDWPGDRIVTIVVATRPGHVEPTGWSFPIVGRVPYKGFFDVEKADAESEQQRARGNDVCQVPVPAYSTLGWFDDPITAPMLRGGNEQTVETVLHELVHATVFVPDEADFNEGVAHFVGQEASVRFLARAGRDGEAESARLRITDWRRIRAETLRLRSRVGELYDGSPDDDARAARRRELEQQTREAVAALDLDTRDAARIAQELRLNDACLGLAGTYEADVDRYGERLAELGGDLRSFVAQMRRAAETPDPRADLLGPRLPDETP
jgi:predicted aminopeptidase